VGILAAKICAGVHYLKAKEGIQVWMVKLAIDTVEKADIEYIQEVLNSHKDKLSVKEGWGSWSLWQRHCRILGIKKLLLVFKHFEVTRAGMDDNYEYW